MDFLTTIIGIIPFAARFLPGGVGSALMAVLPGLQQAAPALEAAGPELAALGQQLSPLLKSVVALVGQHLEGGMSQGDAIAAAALKIAQIHKMTPEEEQAWFDRASRIDVGGM